MTKLDLNQANVDRVIEEEINPILKLHAGGIEVKEIDPPADTIVIRMFGGCSGCPSSLLTLYNGIIPIFQQHFGEINIELE